MEQKTEQQARELVQVFRKRKTLISTRNKLGGIWWPLFRKGVQGFSILATVSLILPIYTGAPAVFVFFLFVQSPLWVLQGL